MAIRIAMKLGDNDAVDELVGVLAGYPIGHLPPLLRAELGMARARLRAAAGDPEAGAAIAARVTEFRALSSPYHLANALLDYADFLCTHEQAPEAELLLDEVRGIGERLGARPLIARADEMLRASVG